MSLLTVLCALSAGAVGARMLPEHFDGVYQSSSSSLPAGYKRPSPSVSPDFDSDPDSYVVSSLPGLVEGDFVTKQWAGQIPIPYAGVDHYGGLFFWLFEPNVTSAKKRAKKPLIVWLNGGPGCSSMDGLFIETGPFRVMPDKSIAVNPLSWHNEGYLLFIDQPIGTGYSYVNRVCKFCDYVHNQSAVNSHIYSALQSLYIAFPFLRDKEVILAGESYAGHYLPAMADYFNTLGKDDGYSGEDARVNVAHVAIGNGWSIPSIQYNFGSYANNLGILSAPDSKKLEAQYELCVKQVKHGDYRSGGSCNIIGQVLAASGACPLAEAASDTSHHGKGITKRHKHKHRLPSNASCYGPLLNYYDTRSYYVDILSSWPASAEVTADYLNCSDVMDAINIKKMFRSYTECNDAGQYLMVLYGLGVQPQIIRILEDGIPVTFYSGQYDFVCNHIGTERMLDQLPWTGGNDFQKAPGYVWVLNHTDTRDASEKRGTTEMVPAGYGRSTSDGRLNFLVVIGGSHMVPMDAPEAALDLIRRIVKKQSFSDYPQEITIITPTETASIADDPASSFASSAASVLLSGVLLAVVVLGAFGYKRLRNDGRGSYHSIAEMP